MSVSSLGKHGVRRPRRQTTQRWVLLNLAALVLVVCLSAFSLWVWFVFLPGSSVEFK